MVLLSVGQVEYGPTASLLDVSSGHRAKQRLRFNLWKGFFQKGRDAHSLKPPALPAAVHDPHNDEEDP